MRVILTKDVPKIGKRDEVKNISDGYALNFLLPRKLAIMATDKAVAELQKKQTEIRVEREVRDDLLLKNLEELKDKTVTIKGKANEKGSLFSSIHKKEIVEALEKEHRAMIDEEYVILDKPIKEIGEFEIPVNIKGKKSSFKLVVEKV